MGAKRTNMVKDTGYKAITGDKFQQIKIALYNGDYGYAANILSKIKLNRKQFTILCHECIEARKVSALKILLEAYSVFWNQELFDDLAKFMVDCKAFEMLSFLDTYIDRVNEYNQKINEWNEYVEKKNSDVEDSRSKKVSFFQKLKSRFIRPKTN